MADGLDTSGLILDTSGLVPEVEKPLDTDGLTLDTSGLLPDEAAATSEAPAPVEDDSSAFGRGFKGGLANQMPQDVANAVEGIGILTDSYKTPEEAEAGIPGYLRDWAKEGTQYKRQVPTFSDIKSPGDVLTYVGESVGGGLASSIPSIITGAGGAYLGERAAGKPGAVAGSLAGAALPSAAQNFGQLYGALKDEGVDPKRAAEWASAASVPITALDVVTPAGIVQRFTGEARKEMVRGIAKRIVSEATKNAVKEGVTEGAQQAIQDATVSAATGKDLFTAENAKDVADNAIQGFLTGGTMGGAEGVLPDKKPGGADIPPPPGAGGESAPETRSPPALDTSGLTPSGPELKPGAVVGLSNPDGSVDRVAISGIDKGIVFYQHPDGTTYGTPLEDFTPAVRPAPPAADTVRGDATTVPPTPEAEPTVVPPPSDGDINDFNPDEALSKPAPIAPKPPEPQQKMALPDTEEITNTEKAAREYRKAAAQAQSLADAKSPQAKSPEEIAQMHRQADALDADAVRLRQTLAARSNTVGGTEAATEEARQRRAAGPLGAVTEGTATGEPDLGPSRQPLAAMEAANRGATGEPVLPATRQPLAAMEAANKGATGEPVLPAPRQPLAAMEAAVKGPTEASTGISLTTPGSPAKKDASPITPEDRADLLNAEPTDAQKEAGNYKKVPAKVGRLNLKIETGKGQERTGVDPDGKPWSVKSPADYGYVNRTTGADNEHLDVYIGDHDPTQHPVWVVDQANLGDSTFDEHKGMLGFKTKQEAIDTYASGFSDGNGGQRIGGVTEMTWERFEKWAANGSKKSKPLAYKPPAKAKPIKKRSVVQFLARSGGLQNDSDFASQDFGKVFVPGAGRLIRTKGGMTFEDAISKMIGDGYFPGVNGDTPRTDPSYPGKNELMDLIGRDVASKQSLDTSETAEEREQVDREPERTPEAEAAVKEEAVRKDLEDLGETAHPEASIEDLEGQLAERLAMMDAASVDEAVRKMQEHQDAMDAQLTEQELEEVRRGAHEGDFADSDVEGEPETSGVSESEPEPETESGIESQDEADGDAAAEAERETGEEGGIARSGGIGDYANVHPAFTNQTFELEMFDQESGQYPEGPDGARKLAIDWVADTGRRTGNEHVVTYDGNDGTIVEAGTSDNPDSVMIHGKAWEAINTPGDSVHIVHNHPNDTSLSPADVSLLAYPGLTSITSVGPGGLESQGSLTDVGRNLASSHTNVEEFQNWLHDTAQKAFDVASSAIDSSWMETKVTPETRLQLSTLAANKALHDAGLITFSENGRAKFPFANAARDAVEQARKAVEDAIRQVQQSPESSENRAESGRRNDRGPALGQRTTGKTTGLLRQNRPDGGSRQTDDEGESTPNDSQRRGDRQASKEQRSINDLDNRRAVRSDGDRTVRQISGGHEASATGRPGDTGSDQSREGTSGDGGGSAGEVASRVNRATSSGPIALRALGKIGDLLSFAATVASKDSVSAKYYAAEKAMARKAETLVRDAAEKVASYLAISPESKTKIHAVLEHDRLAHMDRKDTGRRIAVRMPDEYKGELAKSGDVVTLNADETKAFNDLRKFFDDRWDKFGAAMAKQFGWHGPFNKEAIQKHIDGANSPKAKAQGERAMEIYKMAEEMRRSGYTPFARYGDTKITIRPKPQYQPGKDGLQHFKPARVELVNAKSPLESVFGADASSKSKTVTERVKELQKKFPPSKYDYEVQPLNSLEDLKKVDMPAVEKLFMVINSKDKDLGTKFFDEIVKQIYDERKAGFRKQSHNVAGYSTDFERAIADYIHSTSSTISRMEDGKAVDDAFQATQQHQDPDVSKFWRDYKDHIEAPGDWTAGLRRIGFWAFIWGSAASSLSNLAQSPLVTMPQTAAWSGPSAITHVGNAIGHALQAITVNKDGLTINWDKIGKTPEERAMVARLRAEGVLDPVISKDLQGAGKGTTPSERKMQRKFDRAYDIGASAFNTAEMANRIGAALSAFRLAQNPAVMAKARKVYGRDAEFQEMVGPHGTPTDLARFMVDETQFVGGKRGQPRVMRGAGSLLLQWKQYQANWLRLLYKNMSRMGPEGKAAGTAMLVGLLVTSGFMGLPFAEDLKDAWSWAYKKATGIDPLLERRIASWLNDAGFGDVGAEMILHGGSRQLTGIDLGSRLGMGNMAPDGGIENAFPLLGATIGKASEVAERLKSGQPLGAAAALLPKGVSDIAKAGVVYPTEGLRTQRGDLTLTPSEITAGERISRAVGFQPSRFARLGDYKYSQRELKSATQEASTRLITQLAGELALATDAKKSGDIAASERHTREYLNLLRDNAAQLQDPDLPGWQKIPQPSARAIRTRLQSMISFEPALMKQTSKLKRSEMQDYPLPKE